ncbi:MAG: diaminopimelate decarboxylase [Chloroflexi bacterium]|nr:diaminopimelate decarboxylase [Chloroflexota bacterium]
MIQARLPLFPSSTQVVQDHLTIGGCDVQSLADQYGTPLYIYDRAEMDSAADLYRGFLNAFWPERWSITYAGKAFLCSAIAQWSQSQGFCVDCTGAGEIGIAVQAGLSKNHILVHGVNKSMEDLQAAQKYAGTIVVDNLSELGRLLELAKLQSIPDLWLRFQPGSSVDTHAYTQTGHSGSKFGMSGEQVLEAVEICRHNELPLRGLHFHQGSQFRDPEPLGDGLDRVLDLVQKIGFKDPWHLSPGGGWGVSYHEGDLPHPPIEMYVRFITANLLEGCQKRGLSLPHLHLEPGRSLVARAGVAVYRVGTVKQTSGKTWLLIDGGMADNPRHALYGARYSCLTVNKPFADPASLVSIAGPYCESGDVLIEQIPLRDVSEDELIAIPVSGAYHMSMSSNYNGARRPAVLLIENGKPRLIQARETPADLFRRDLLPDD